MLNFGHNYNNLIDENNLHFSYFNKVSNLSISLKQANRIVKVSIHYLKIISSIHIDSHLNYRILACLEDH